MERSGISLTETSVSDIVKVDILMVLEIVDGERIRLARSCVRLIIQADGCAWGKVKFDCEGPVGLDARGDSNNVSEQFTLQLFVS